MATLNPYLTFKGNCKEAMGFYKEIFGGELSLMTAGESPVANQMPASYHNSILHSSLKRKISKSWRLIWYQVNLLRAIQCI